MPQEQKKAPRVIPKGTLPASAQQLLDDMVTGPMTLEAVQDVSRCSRRRSLSERWAQSRAITWAYQNGPHKPESSQNQRNGNSAKTILTDTGSVHLNIPWDCDASFEPILIPKYERRFTGGLKSRGCRQAPVDTVGRKKSRNT